MDFSIKHEHIQRAYELSQEKRVRVQVSNDVFVYSAKANADPNLNTPQYLRQWHYQIYQDNVANWAHYSNNRHLAHAVTRNADIFKCTCWIGHKKSICKHAVATMIEIGVFVSPQNFLGVPVEVRRKRGRPRKVGKALVRDD